MDPLEEPDLIAFFGPVASYLAFKDMNASPKNMELIRKLIDNLETFTKYLKNKHEEWIEFHDSLKASMYRKRIRQERQDLEDAVASKVKPRLELDLNAPEGALVVQRCFLSMVQARWK
jgi:hypothetical protein